MRWLPTSTASKAISASPSDNPLTDPGLLAARALSYAALLLTAGVPLYMLAAGRALVSGKRSLPIVAVLALTALAASVWGMFESVASMLGVPVGEVDLATLQTILAATPLGSVFAIRGAALLLTAFAAARRKCGLAAISASIALATNAWTGHAGATEDGLGTLHRLSDIVHLLAAAMWLGALVIFLGALLGRSNRDALLRSLAGFAATGTILVLLLLATGIVNMIVIAGWPPAPTSGWAVVLMAKLGLFAAMLGFAALNRWRLAPALAADAPGADRALRRSLGAETAAGFAVLLAVALLGTLSPT